ncbi:efflux RND transporter permease subunit [Tessaracoccus caeni]|uniref:efflux RND transporter permease subunit n=1 Tax=Tessaracoccus caeni TaxID=3031239 RepID=UPI0023DC86BC|nr:efflux RND transporter permease subunit [Tessaracoccus caeni]MDF1486760.1 efflux RND transporter permease subunit [Tessaracoccus caeni]
MSRLTNLSLAHRTVVLLLSLLTIGLGVYAAGALKQELIPSMSVPQGAVVTVYPGASPEVVEEEVSKPIEAAIKAVDGITDVTSTSSSSVSQVAIQWDYDYESDEIASNVNAAIDAMAAGLPSNLDPRVVTGSIDDVPVMILALSSDVDATTLSQQANDVVLPALRGIHGVRDVALTGQETHEVIVTYDPETLREAGVDPATIGQFFMANGTAIPSGTIHADGANLDVQTGTSFSSVEDLKGLMLQGSDGPVVLGDVATVVEQPVETASVSRVNGRPSLTLSVTKTADANTVSISHEVQDAVADLSEQLGGGASFDVVFDQSPFIEQSIHDLSVEGGIGLVMAILVIMIFLGSIRPTLITAVSIPLALLMALIGLWVGGHTLNILTLGALTVAIGRVVDDSIVVIENIKRHQSLGEWGRGSIVAAVKEVAGAITSSTLTTVAVFLPIGLVGGQAGEMFRPFALTVTVALLASLLVSLTVVPVLASWFMRPSEKKPPSEDKETNTWLHKAYNPVLGWSLRHRVVTLLLAVGIFAGTLALTPYLKTDFIGSAGMDSLQVTQKLPQGTPLEETDAAAAKVENVLKDVAEVESYSTSIGGSSSIFMGSQTGTNQATFTATLKPGTDTSAVAAAIREKLSELVGAGTIDVGVGMSDQTSQMVLYVESADSEALTKGSEQVLAMLKGIDDLSSPSSDLGDARDMLSVDVDAKVAATNGLTQAQIGQVVARAVRGELIGSLTHEDTTLDVYLRSQDPVKSVEELRAIPLPVTQTMVMNARKDAAEKVTERQEEMTEEAKAQADDAYDEQVVKLKDARSQAKKASAEASRKLDEATEQLEALQDQLKALQTPPSPPVTPDQPVEPSGSPEPTDPADPTDPTQPSPSPTTPSMPVDPPITVSVFQLTKQVDGLTQQVIQLTQGVAAADGQVDAIDEQLDALAEQRDKSLESQADQEKLADDAKAAQELNPDAIVLSDVADVEIVQAPGTITRVNGVRAATLSAGVEGGDLTAVTSAVQTGIDGLELPDGVTVRLGGVTEMQQEAFAQLGLAMVVAVLVVYLIMVATFGSLLQPLILLVSIPFAATGALGLSLLTDTPIGVPSMIGLLMLIGVVVTNAIVLIDLVNQKRKEGAGVDEAIEQGARLRLRPIVMTALATIFALIPMGLGLTGGGVFISKPLAIVVIGGLVSSTLLTLILVPVLYDILEKWRERGATRRESKRAARGRGDGDSNGLVFEDQTP